MMSDVKNLLNDDDLFGDNVDTSKEAVDLHWKQKNLKDTTSGNKRKMDTRNG